MTDRPTAHSVVPYGLGLLLAAIVWHGLRPAADLDVWWHIQTGSQLVRSGTLLATDPFSHTHPGAPWPWKDAGAAVVLYAVHAAAGVAGLVILKAVLLAGATALIWRNLDHLRRVPPTLGLVVLVVTVQSMAFRFTERPATFSLVLAAVAVLIIERHRRSIARSARELWWLVPLTVLNANLHRAALLIPVLAGAYAVARGLQRMLGNQDATWRQPALITIGTALGCLATPFGTNIFTTTVGLMGEHTAMLTEWAPVRVPLVRNLTPASFVMGAFVVLGGVRSLWVRPRDPWDPILAALALAVGLGSMRHLPYLAILGAGPAASGLAGLGGERVSKALTTRIRKLVVLAIPAMAFVYELGRPLPAPALGVAPAHLPGKGFAFVRDQPRDLELQGPMFNEFGYGGYLIYHLWPRHRVYIDGRTDLVYPPEFVQRYIAAMTDARVLQQELERYQIQWLLLDNAPHRGALAALDTSPDWILVHVSRRALVYVRRDGPNRALAERRGYRFIHAHRLRESVDEAAARGLGAAAFGELKRMLEEDPDNIYAKAIVADLGGRAPRGWDP